MVKCLSKIKDFVTSVFTQDESIGLKSIEKMKLVQEVCAPKKDSDYKLSDIMKS